MIGQKKKEICFAILVLIGLICIFYFEVLFGGKVFVSPDSQASRVLAESIKDKALFPQYMPYIFSGMPATLVYNNPLTYFPNTILIWFSTMWQHLSHYLLAGLGMFLLLKEWKVNWLSAMVGAIAFVFSTNMIAQEVFGHGGLMMTAAYIPIIMWVLEKSIHNWLRIRTELFYSAILALLIGLQFQRGHIQIVYYTWMLIGIRVLWQYVIGNRQLWRGKQTKLGWRFMGRRMLFIIVALIGGFGLAALKWWPILEYSKYSIRDALSFDYASSWSLHPKEIITFILPDFYGFGGSNYTGYLPFTDYANYLGLVVVVCAFLAIRQKWWLWAVVGGSIIIAFGKYTPVYGLLFKYLPFFDRFRVPMMILILTQFSIAALAGLGFQRIYDFASKTKVKAMAYGVALILLADLAFVGNRINNPGELKAYDIQKDDIAEFLEQDTGIYRVYFKPPLFNVNKYAKWGIESIGGYHPAKLRIYQDFLDNPTPEKLELLNVKYIVDFEPVTRQPVIGRVEEFRPRYTLDGKVEVLERDIDRVRLRVQSKTTQDLIISEIYYPAWKVYIDGVEQEVKKYKDLICSVEVSAGKHIVEFKFESKAFKYGAIMSILSLMIICVGIIMQRRR
jgi:hypothetical protein